MLVAPGVVRQEPLLQVPMAALVPLSVPVTNDLLVRWGHRFGPVHRPFRSEAFALEVDGVPVALAVSASVVSGTVAGFRRQEAVELARLCASPEHRWATRVMLRLWREVCAPRWKCWPVRVAVAYSQNAHHLGDVYRFDGWRRVSDNCGSSGGGAWSRPRYASDAVYGKKTLWVYEYGS